jgi:hypothetical protein
MVGGNLMLIAQKKLALRTDPATKFEFHSNRYLSIVKGGKLTREDMIEFSEQANRHGVGMDLAKKDLSKLDLSGIDFKYAYLSHTDVTHADMSGVKNLATADGVAFAVFESTKGLSVSDRAFIIEEKRDLERHFFVD